MNQIASQPGITEVKRLRMAKTQIFNNQREGEFLKQISFLVTLTISVNTMNEVKFRKMEGENA